MIEPDVDDGSGKPEGFQTEDGHLEVREGEYHETPLGQHERWLTQAPDLYEMYQASLEALTTTKVEMMTMIEAERARGNVIRAQNDKLTVELTALYASHTAAIEALAFYAKGWPNGIDGGNKAIAALELMRATQPKDEVVSA